MGMVWASPALTFRKDAVSKNAKTAFVGIAGVLGAFVRCYGLLTAFLVFRGSDV